MAAVAVLQDISDETKLLFAAALARTKNPSSAALQVISNAGLALQASQFLPNDPLVIEEMKRLEEEVGEEGLLPKKAEIARRILQRAEDAKDAEDYERLMKLYCSIMGHIERPGTTVNTNVQVAPVMVVRDHGSDEEWAAKVAAQQKKLVIDAAS